jgi:hypothetical protein
VAPQKTVAGVVAIAATDKGYRLRVAGAIFTQVLPFFDPGVLKLYGAFEKGVYQGLSRA